MDGVSILTDEQRSVVERICAFRGADVEKVLGRGQDTCTCIARGMVYAFFHNKMGVSGDKMAAMFGRTRVNILRTIRSLRHNMQFSRPMRAEWKALMDEMGIV